MFYINQKIKVKDLLQIGRNSMPDQTASPSKPCSSNGPAGESQKTPSDKLRKLAIKAITAAMMTPNKEPGNLSPEPFDFESTFDEFVSPNTSTPIRRSYCAKFGVDMDNEISPIGKRAKIDNGNLCGAMEVADGLFNANKLTISMDDENKENIVPTGTHFVHPIEKAEIRKNAMVFAGFNGGKDLDKCQIVTGTTTKEDQTTDESNGAAMRSLAVDQEKDKKIVQDDSEKEYVPTTVQNIELVSKNDHKAEKGNGNRESGLEIQPPNCHQFIQQDLNERDSSGQYEPEHIEQEYYAGGFEFTPPQAVYGFDSFDLEDRNTAEPNADEIRDESNQPENYGKSEQDKQNLNLEASHNSAAAIEQSNRTNAVPNDGVDLNASLGNGNQIDQKLNSSIEVVSVIPAQIQVVAVIPGHPNVAPSRGEDLAVEPQPGNGGEIEQDPRNMNMERVQDLNAPIEQDLNGSIEFVAEIPPEVQIVAEVHARHNGPPVNVNNKILDRIANR